MFDEPHSARSLVEGYMRTSLMANGTENPNIEQLTTEFNKAVQLVEFRYRLEGLEGGLPERAVIDRWFEDVKENYTAVFSLGSIVTEQNYSPWWLTRKSEVEDYYWQRYTEHLATTQNWSPNAITNLSRESDRALDLCADPAAQAPQARRGLVLGSVQSGKTSNYIGLMAKAADAGYDIILVIAGIQDALRTQTQIRIEESLVGFDISDIGKHKSRKVGVGTLPRQKNATRTRRFLTRTTRTTDFRRSHARLDQLEEREDPLLLVVKKNAAILETVYEWFNSHRNSEFIDINSSILVIDDEADNASINVHYARDNVSKINGLIRKILTLFKHTSYVGYTATPFANIFIDPMTEHEMLQEDLFPRDFILSLEPPSHYFGPKKIFLSRPLEEGAYHPYLREVDDYHDLIPRFHNKDLRVEELPESLKEATRSFIISVALRRLRGHVSQHHSMLVNVSRFVNVQNSVSLTIERFLDELKNSLKIYGGLTSSEALQDDELAALNNLWKEEYQSEFDDWSTVMREAREAIKSVAVVEVNSKGKGPLGYEDYPTGRSVIAVGGMSLSRGLTLEGLSVSYYLRRTLMYDTLMQMGRWFGYRAGYEDLCRIYMPPDVIDHFEHVTESLDELFSDLTEMQRIGSTPREFGLKVRSHPDLLEITARDKRGASETRSLSLDLSNQLIESTVFYRDSESTQRNYELVMNLLKRLSDEGAVFSKSGPGNYITKIENADIIRRFISGFQAPKPRVKNQPEVLNAWIDTLTEAGRNSWSVVFSGVSPTNDTHLDPIAYPNFTIHPQRRTRDRSRTTSDLIYTKKDRISSRGIDKFGLSDQDIFRAEQEYRLRENAEAKYFPDSAYRAVRSSPLLVVHHFEFLDDEGLLEVDQPLIGWSISFPPQIPGVLFKPTHYTFNAVALDEIDQPLEEFYLEDEE